MTRKLKHRLRHGSLTTYGLVIPGVALLVIAMLAVTAPDTQAQAKTGPPQNAQTAVTSDTITLTWEAPSGEDCEPSYYYITLVNADYTYTDYATVYMPAELKKVFEGLEPKTHYTLGISAYSDECGWSADGSVANGPVISVRTTKKKKATATPDPTPEPTAVATPEPTPTPRGILEIIPGDDNTEEQVATTTTVWNWTIVTPKKPQKTTVISPPVTNLRISAISATTTTIAWDDADPHSSSEGCASADPRVYRYTVMDLDKTGKDAKRIHKKVEVATSTSVTLTNLKADGRYWIIVKSKGTAGCEATWTDYRSPRIRWRQPAQ